MPRVAVLGDFMRDIWWIAEPHGVSQDSGCLRYVATQRLTFPGGAGNVAHNLLVLGCTPITLGNNVYDARLIKKYRLCSPGPDYPQVFRWDYNDSAEPIPLSELRSINWESLTGVVISDYAKGSIDASVIDYVARNSVGPVIIDSKQGPAPFSPINAKRIIFVPNHLEYEAHKDTYDTYENVVVKEGPRGCSLVDRGRHVCSCPAYAAAPLSTCGAGDVTVAALTDGLLRHRLGPGPQLLAYAMRRTGEALNASRYTCQIPASVTKGAVSSSSSSSFSPSSSASALSSN